ncbi:hypothetical protein V7S43_005382 [Phytophthora oleae]|uniref:Uncharacterized protein n=1 Tax=Phytophthora oleae TaxID=2107226 RepID=A0ABD3FWE8_9STRA
MDVPRAVILCSPGKDSSFASAASLDSSTWSGYCAAASSKMKPLGMKSFMNATTSLDVDRVCFVNLSVEFDMRGACVYHVNQASFKLEAVETLASITASRNSSFWLAWINCSIKAAW